TSGRLRGSRCRPWCTGTDGPPRAAWGGRRAGRVRADAVVARRRRTPAERGGGGWLVLRDGVAARRARAGGPCRLGRLGRMRGRGRRRAGDPSYAATRRGPQQLLRGSARG